MAKATKQDRDLLETLRERYKVAAEADHENRQLALDDLKFCYEVGAQWDENVKRERGERPCLEFNKLPRD